jgi:hypothetical protein
MKRFAELGHGVAIGHQSACARAGEFTRVIHIKDPGEKSCPNATQDHLVVSLKNKTPLGPRLIMCVYNYARNSDRLLIHCHVGMHRSPTLAVIALHARGLSLGTAEGIIVDATLGYEESPTMPHWEFSVMQEIGRVLCPTS